MEITQQLVKQLFDYHSDGYLIWTGYQKHNKRRPGERAGSLNKLRTRNVYRVKIYYKEYILSRIIFLWHHGYLPVEVDHKDNDCMNNKIDNLRPATRTQNMWNKTKVKNSASKYIGVYLRKDLGKWYAQIRINNKTKHLGLFVNEIDAAIARDKVAIKYYGEYANLNNP